MKKIMFISIVFFALVSSTKAQSVLDKAEAGDVSKLASSFDVKSIASSVMAILTPSLGLSDGEQPNILSEVTSLLTKKKDLLPLQTTDKAAYTSKFSALTGGFLTKMKGILTAAKYAKLLGLKPKIPSANNVLSQLFF